VIRALKSIFAKCVPPLWKELHFQQICGYHRASVWSEQVHRIEISVAAVGSSQVKQLEITESAQWKTPGTFRC
jgi:hypothetical protein